jgi:hypothetical protein
MLAMKLTFREFIKLVLLYDSEQYCTWVNVDGISGYLMILYLPSTLLKSAALNTWVITVRIFIY